MSDDQPDGPVHWALALMAALLIVVLAVPVLSAASPFGRAKRAQPYQLTNNLKGKAIFKATSAMPGSTGSGRVVISNTGTKPFRKVLLTQASPSNGIGPALQLQIFDSTTKRCLYPKPILKKPRKGRPAPKPPTRCLTWSHWTGKAKLRNLVVDPTKGKAWRPKERHVIHVRWKLGTNVPEGRTAKFNLSWRASA